MMELYHRSSDRINKLITRAYSTSFSLGILGLNKSLRDPVYGIYGFVRIADEIVDTFQGHDKAKLLKRFWQDTHLALEEKVSINPVLHSFQRVVHQYNIDPSLIDTFLSSMEMDLEDRTYSQAEYEKYILGSAEVVGLMCLKVFVKGDEAQYQALTPSAMKLGSAFQKINFLRDVSADFHALGRTYFPNVDLSRFDDDAKRAIEADIAIDFRRGYEGILRLPKGARFGVYIAYMYYYDLFKKIMRTPSARIFQSRIRIHNQKKYRLFVSSYVRHALNLL
ncbi:MAG: phytoene synthase [Cryomorphaceae bacterium BACL7 MAG-120322-bin74]|jgi:15-cis-phytoene synthase|nr:MAG: phytoene synthase [Cryomorphaceae bacterium BACL7 MAG-120322-bin74]